MAKALPFLYAEKLVAIILGLVSSVVLARVLSPEEIGVASLAAAAAAICHMLRDMGVGTHIGTAPSITPEHRRACQGLAYLLSVGAGLILVAVSIPLANFYAEPRLKDVVYLLAMSMALAPTVSIRNCFLVREGKFVELSLFGIFNNVCFCVFSIWFALHGQSYLSVPLATLSAALCTTVLALVRGGFKSMFYVRFSGIGGILSISKWPFLSILSNTVAERSPEFSLARTQGFSASAYFEKSLTAVDLAKRLVVDALLTLLHPRLLACRENPDKMRLIVTETIAIFLLVGCSISVVLAPLSSTLVTFLFGENWSMSGKLLGILAWIAPFALGSYVSVQLLMHTEGQKGAAIANLFGRSFVIVLVIVGANFGLQVTPYALITAEFVVFLGLLFLLRKYIDWSLLGRALLSILPLVFVGGLAVYTWSSYAKVHHFKLALEVLAAGPIALLAAGLGYLVYRPKLVAQLLLSYGSGRSKL